MTGEHSITTFPVSSYSAADLLDSPSVFLQIEQLFVPSVPTPTASDIPSSASEFKIDPNDSVSPSNQCKNIVSTVIPNGSPSVFSTSDFCSFPRNVFISSI